MLYIAATSTVVSAANAVERKEGHAYKLQRLVYYISEVLTDSKI
jgi:hypothetical protein